jgi:multimeric flavodoxin WrbA
MNITILTGSPRKNGNTNYLVEQFAKGATEAGNEVFVFDCAKHKVGPCTACNKCGMNGPCVQKDDFEIISPHILNDDMIVFATPVYWFGASTQIKSVIDRFHGIAANAKIKGKKCALLTVMANSDAKAAQSIAVWYDTVAGYLSWKDCGKVQALGVMNPGDILKTGYGQKAYELGKGLK